MHRDAVHGVAPEQGWRAIGLVKGYSIVKYG
jgi:hypothetical protein